MARQQASIFGIDIARGQWAVTKLPRSGTARERPEAMLVPFDGLASLLRPRDLAIIDIPIDLSSATEGTGDRDVDRACRKWCFRSGSVFPPPTSTQLRAALRGRRPAAMSVQTFGICRAIEAARVASERHPNALFESHPEVVFTALGSAILGSPKKTLGGAIARANLLQARVGFDVLGWVTQAEAAHPRSGANDWLDALAMLVVAGDWTSEPRSMLQNSNGAPTVWKRGTRGFVALPSGTAPEPPHRPERHAAAYPVSPRATPCTCGALDEAARDPHSPIRFDEATGEFELVLLRRQGTAVVRHCYWCGGHAPESRRDELFAHVTHAEEERLFALVAGLDTPEKAIAKLGPPDFDFPTGLIVGSAPNDGKAATRTGFRAFGYHDLSRTAEVRFTDHRPQGGSLVASLQGKYIGPAKQRGRL